MKLITLENLKSFWKDVKSYVDNGLSKKADSVHGTHVIYGTINGEAPGTPSAGTSSKVAREDHVHPVQTTVSGNAGSATKLATPRAINGTNFDGTGNITTANWGTARTLTIGSASKSVNGSGNVTWSLAEMGAAPIANGVQRWSSVIKCATWSRLLYLTGNTTVGHSFILNIQGTRGNVVFNASFLVNASHSSVASIVQLNNTKYSNFQIRAVTNSDGDVYIEVYDNANSATNSTTQTLNVSFTALSGVGTGALTKYTSFTDGSTLASGFAVAHTITTVSGNHYSGNAATATKATQDSAGQQINTTYIKGLSVNGRTITYTKGDGTTGSITTQDTNTTYSTGTTSTSGLTKLYTGTGTATDGTMTQSAIKTALDGKAASSHTHSYLPLSGGTLSGILRMENANYGPIVIRRTSGTTHFAGIKFENTAGYLGSIGMGDVNGGLYRYNTNENDRYLILDQNNYRTVVTPANIGAAASSHTHNYAGSNSAGGPANKVNLPRLTGSSNTPNYLPGSSTFEIKEFGNDCSNMPTAAWYHILTGQGNDANYNTQLALGMTNQAVFYRYRNSGAWGSWKQLAFTDSSITGNAGTATKLQTARSINGTNFDGTGNITTANWGTARTLTIGNTGKSVNGSGNVSWSLSEIGALPLTGGTMTGNLSLSSTAPIVTLKNTSGSDASLVFDRNSNANWRVRNTAGDLLFESDYTTEKGSYYTGLKLAYNSGDVTAKGEIYAKNGQKVYHTGNPQTSITGNAGTATTLQTTRTINGTSFNGSANITTANWGTARTLTIGNTGKSVNGSGNVSWSLSEIGALPLTGGTLSGRLTANGRISAPTAGSSWISGMTVTNATIGISTQQAPNSYHPVLAVKTSGNHVANIGGIGDDFGFYGFKSGRTENATDWSFKINVGTGAVSSTGNITAPTFVGALSGNASTATKATQDSAGQQINKTYIKGLSVSGKTITYTKGDGTTGTITTQDTNTTYSTGTSSVLGLTKLYTGTGTATDGTMTQNAINTALNGKANSSHGRHIPDSCATITDWNSATTTGWYMASNASNAPSTAWYFGEVVAHNTNYVIQTVYQFTASTDAKAIPKYIRAKMNGTWGAWTNVTVAKAVPSNAVFTDTNTWRGVQNNLTSDATDQSLSAAQGKVLKGLVDGKANSSHTHNYAGSSSAGGAANSATKLATARTIKVGNTGKSFDGSGGITFTLAEMGIVSGTSAPSNSDGRADGTVYFRYA